MFRSPSGRQLVSRVRAARRVALVVSLFAAASLSYVNAGAWRQEEEGQPRKSQPTVKGQANIIAGAEFVPGDVLVRFRTDAEAKRAEAAPLSLQRAEDGGNVTFQRFEGSEMVEGLRLAKVVESRTLDAVAELASRPDVLYAEPNYIWRTKRTPNDPRYVSGEMYGLNKIGAPAAWNTTVGSKNVVVGVLDGGVDINHPDLSANIWTNPGEVAGNNLDDDGNGFADDIHGWDFHHNDSSVFDNEDGDDHATHVAGTIGAKGDNNLGVAGVNWDVSLISIKVLGPDGGATANIIKGYNYARKLREAGVNLRVLNNSYGGPVKSLAALDAINQLNTAGILFVAAAGNDGRDNFAFPEYPASYDAPNVISVAWTNSADNLSGLSNFGARLVSISAPGQGILSTTPNNTFSFLNGTSMAAPHVAGAAALICASNPTCANSSAVNSGITTAQLRGLLIFTGDRIPALESKTTTGRRLNVANAVAGALENDTTAPATPGNFRVIGQSGRSITLAWTAPGDDGNTGTVADYDFFFVNPTTQARTLLPTTLIPTVAGTQQVLVVNVPLLNFSGTIQLRAYDNAGNASTASVSFALPSNGDNNPYTVTLSAASGLAPISGTSLVTGDDKYVAYNMPFTVPFYGLNDVNLTISTNGAIYFSTPPRHTNGDADDAVSSVNALQSQRMIAGLWDDLDINTTLRPDSGVFVRQPDANHVIFRWQGVTFETPHTNVNFEIELRNDGTIQMRYGDNPRIFPVVGISSGEPDAYVVASHTREFDSENPQPLNLSGAQTVTFAPHGTPGFSISGNVRDVNGAAVPNVTITLSGGSNAVTMTSGSGDYSFIGLAGGVGYTVTPSHPNYFILPPNFNIENLNANDGVSFLASRKNVCTEQLQFIDFGQTINSTLAAGDCLNPITGDGSKVDEYVFTASAGQQLAVSMSSTAFDTVLYVINPDGTVLAIDGDTNTNVSTDSRIPRTGFITLPSSGTYSILASSFRPEEEGAYTLSLTAGAICNVTPIAYGETKAGTLSSGDCKNQIDQDNTPVDYYTFSGTAGQQIAITLTSVSGTAIDPDIYLLTPNGDLLAEDDNGGGDSAARIPQGAGFGRLPSSGTYTIVVNTLFASQSGNYSLTLTKAATDCESVPLTFGTTVNGSLANGDCRLPEDGSFIDAYTFTGTANGQVVITMTSSTGGLLPVLFLLAPRGDVLAIDGDGDSTARIPGGTATFTLPTAGTYTVLANSFQPGQTGNYTLALTTSVQQNTHTISGQVTGGGVGLSGVTVTSSGGTSATTTTDANGNYSFAGLPSGSNYTITPTDTAQYSFTPQMVSALQADQIVNFNGTLRTYTVSGQVTTGGTGLSGATVTLAGANGFTPRISTTAADGRYSFPGVPAGGNYTVTATKVNYTFVPSEIAVANLLADRTEANFAATLNTHTISGRIMVGTNGLAGVSITLSGSTTGMTQTDASGNYSFNVAAGGTYTVTPSKAFYSFDASNQTFLNITTNQTANFTATLLTFTLSGRVS